MGYALTRKTVETMVSTAWTDVTVTIIYDNVPTKRLDSTVEVRILSNTANQVEMTGSSPAYNRYTGLVCGVVSVPEATGTEKMFQIIDAFGAIFRRKTEHPTDTDTYRFGVSRVTDFGVIDGKRVSAVYIPFTRDSRE